MEEHAPSDTKTALTHSVAHSVAR